MRNQLKAGIAFLLSQKGRYLVVGGANTVINYLIGSIIYQILLPRLNFFIVGAIVTVVTISVSFTSQKVIVFRTKGKWWVEYLRSYVVYGSSAVLNVGLMWVLINTLRVNIWVAQAIVTFIAVVISYVGHTAFTFRERKHHDQATTALSARE